MKVSAAVSLLHLFGAVYSNTLPKRNSELLPNLVDSDVTDKAYEPSSDGVGVESDLSLEAYCYWPYFSCLGRCCRYSCCYYECCAADAQFCYWGRCYKWA
jgi:hypothetical protein